LTIDKNKNARDCRGHFKMHHKKMAVGGGFEPPRGS